LGDNKESKEQQHKDMMELHERITELQKLEIEREKIENQLRKINEKIDKMFSQAKEGLVIIQNRLVKYASPYAAELTGRTVDEIINTSFAQYIHHDELPRLAKYYLQRIAGEDVPNIYETIIKHKDGSDVYIAIKASVIQYQGRSADFAIVRKIPKPNNK